MGLRKWGIAGLVVAAMAVAAAPAAAANGNLAVTISAPATTAADTDLAYAIRVTNNGPDPSSGVVLTTGTPQKTTLAAPFATPIGWSGSAPVAGQSGVITATKVAALPASSFADFTLVAHVNPGTAPGTQILQTAFVTASTADGDGTDNVANFISTIPAAPTPVPVVTKKKCKGKKRGRRLASAAKKKRCKKKQKK